MSWFRALRRLVAIVGLALVMYLWLLVSSLALALLNGARGRGFWSSTRVWRSGILHRWSPRLLPLIGIRLIVQGTPPSPPCVLVSNHLSYLDILLLAGQLPAVFIAKSQVRKWPLLGTMCALVDTQFIDRERKSDIPRMMDSISDIMASGRGVVFFPEGTTSNGRTVQAFRPALLEAPIRSGQPVSWATISYRAPPGGPAACDAVCWWGGAGFAGHLMTLLRMPWVEARVIFGAERIRAEDRKSLALRLHATISREFVPVV